MCCSRRITERGRGIIASAGAAALSRHRSPTEELRERVLREIAAFVGDAPQHDDMTMLLIRIGQPAHESLPLVESVAAEARS